jgi:hypothetical protein
MANYETVANDYRLESRLNSLSNCQGRLACLYGACVVQTGNRVAVRIISNQLTSGTYVTWLVGTEICKTNSGLDECL